MNLKLNFFGMHVSDFAPSFRFYTEMLGINATDKKSGWAYMDTRGMTFELFGDRMPPNSQPAAWGQGRPLRPSLQVADLHQTITELRQRGVRFTGPIQRTELGEWIEFMAPEAMPWTLAHAPAYPFSANLHQPRFGWIELKVERLNEQRAFYCEVMGLQPEAQKDGQVVLRQAPGEPLLILETGGQHAEPFQINQRMLEPFPCQHISFETDDIEGAAAWLKSRGVPILNEVAHRDWGGIDVYIADPDGNPIQVVQYVPL